MEEKENVVKKLFILIEPGKRDSSILYQFMESHDLNELFEQYMILGLSVEVEGRIHALRQMTFLWESTNE